MNKYIISVLVENHAGVLSKVVALFSRRGFNINSLAVGETQDETVSRITIEVSGDEYTVDQVSKQLNKLIDVIKVKVLNQDCIKRELILVKVNAPSPARQEVVQISDVFRAKIVDISAQTLTLELTGAETKTEAFLQMLEPFGILELARTGMIALERGTNVITHP